MKNTAFDFMKTNEIFPKANLRMNRIQKVSRYVRLWLLYGIPLYTMGFFVVIFLIPKGWVTAGLNTPEVSAWVKAAATTTYHLWTVSALVLLLFWYRMVLKLFGFFEKGFLFTAETVRCIQILGGIYVAEFLVRLLFYFLVPEIMRDSMMTASVGNLFAGLFIVFIGWLIDEARKIQEEQALTV